MDDLSKKFHSLPFFVSIINRRQYEELSTLPLPESTLITIHRCQVCNKEQQQQQGNTTICSECQDDEEIARLTRNTTDSVSQYVYLRCYSIIQTLAHPSFSFFISLHQ